LISGIDGLFKYQLNINQEYQTETMSKKIIIAVLMVAMSLGSFAQQRTTRLTLYRQFKPSTITLKTGQKIKQSLTNVFLKNSTLVYLKDEYTMEANMDNIAAVEFDDRTYVNINNQLAYLVDSVGGNCVYRIDIFDMDAYNAQLRNNVNINAIPSFSGDMISTSSVDLNTEEDYKFPVFPHFYLSYNGEIIKAHEREISRRLPKDEDIRRKYRTAISMDGFSWIENESVVSVLRAITPTKEQQEEAEP